MSYLAETWTAATITLGFKVFLPNLQGIFDDALLLDVDEGVEDFGVEQVEVGEEG